MPWLVSLAWKIHCICCLLTPCPCIESACADLQQHKLDLSEEYDDFYASKAWVESQSQASREMRIESLQSKTQVLRNKSLHPTVHFAGLWAAYLNDSIACNAITAKPRANGDNIKAWEPMLHILHRTSY